MIGSILQRRRRRRSFAFDPHQKDIATSAIKATAKTADKSIRKSIQITITNVRIGFGELRQHVRRSRVRNGRWGRRRRYAALPQRRFRHVRWFTRWEPQIMILRWFTQVMRFFGVFFLFFSGWRGSCYRVSMLIDFVVNGCQLAGIWRGITSKNRKIWS